MEKIPNKHELWLLWEQAEGLKYGSPQIKKKKKRKKNPRKKDSH